MEVTESPKSCAWLELPHGRVAWLDQAVTSIGRNAPRTLVFNDTFLSGSHAVIEEQGPGLHTLTDLRSTNGTFLDDRRISEPTLLHNGAQIRVGEQVLVYRTLTGNPAGEGRQVVPTSVRTYDGNCWLMLVDLIGFTVTRQRLGPAAAELIRDWIVEIKPIIEGSGGVLNSQAGDALLVYWRSLEPAETAARIARAVPLLRQLQQARQAQAPFRIILHFAHVQISTNATRAEQLSGPEVDFLFRIEKLAKPLGVDFLISAPAAEPLAPGLELRDLGAHPVQSFPGSYRFCTVI